MMHVDFDMIFKIGLVGFLAVGSFLLLAGITSGIYETIGNFIDSRKKT